MDTLLQSQSVAAQNGMQVKRGRKDTIPFISRCKESIDTLHMRG